MALCKKKSPLEVEIEVEKVVEEPKKEEEQWIWVVGATKDVMKIKKLEELGYSMAFAKFLIAKNKFEIAEAVGSQPDLSMDMKVMLIMNM